MRATGCAALLLLVGTTAAQTTQNCGNGEFSARTGCCVCNVGYKDGSTPSSPCSVCAEGFYRTSPTAPCTNGRPGSECVAGAAFPAGCGQRGTCSTGSGGRMIFPCATCDSPLMDPATNCKEYKRKDDGSLAVQPDVGMPGTSWATCLPKGPRMYTPFPNPAVVEKPFNLIIVGCDVKQAAEYLVIPGEKSCQQMNTALDASCVFTSSAPKAISDKCKETGWRCNGCVTFENSGQTEVGMSEVTISNITYNTGSLDTKTINLKLCQQMTRMKADGSTEKFWFEVDAHNTQGYMRAETFPRGVDGGSDDPAVRGAAGLGGDGGDGGNCCEGLKLGDGCLPLWAFLLLWLLMAALLGILALMLHKNQKEIDMEKNNQKFSNFGTDKELMDMAAEPGAADDDDDI
eukprot:TRINITY_DN3540_c0_g1_i1.p2 TRINITY_DN3540_c0_g1~~TRINITY_DN3540_c0_g1_i1.p2  ORF type:complete len:436 (+),score=146.08 TRINITY_DN3540_c0_g1_i1:103-1308(+)